MKEEKDTNKKKILKDKTHKPEGTGKRNNPIERQIDKITKGVQ